MPFKSANNLQPWWALVAQWVKRWPTDLVVMSSSPTWGKTFSIVNAVPLHTAFHYHPPMHRPVIWLNYCWKGHPTIHHNPGYPTATRELRSLCTSLNPVLPGKSYYHIPVSLKAPTPWLLGSLGFHYFHKSSCWEEINSPAYGHSGLVYYSRFHIMLSWNYQMQQLFLFYLCLIKYLHNSQIKQYHLSLVESPHWGSSVNVEG